MGGAQVRELSATLDALDQVQRGGGGGGRIVMMQQQQQQAQDPLKQARITEDRFFAGLMDQQPEPDSIVKTSFKFDPDGDVQVFFETRTHRFGVVIILQDKKNLGWKECQALSAALKIAARGTKMSNQLLQRLGGQLEEKFGAIRCTPDPGTRRLALHMNPTAGSVRYVDAEQIQPISVNFTDNGDFLVIGTTSAGFFFTYHIILLSAQNSDGSVDLSIKECECLADVFLLAETGDKMNKRKFFAYCADLQQKYNKVTDATSMVSGAEVTTCTIVPTIIDRQGPLDRKYVDAKNALQNAAVQQQQQPTRSPEPSRDNLAQATREREEKERREREERERERERENRERERLRQERETREAKEKREREDKERRDREEKEREREKSDRLDRERKEWERERQERQERQEREDRARREELEKQYQQRLQDLETLHKKEEERLRQRQLEEERLRTAPVGGGMQMGMGMGMGNPRPVSMPVQQAGPVDPRTLNFPGVQLELQIACSGQATVWRAQYRGNVCAVKVFHSIGQDGTESYKAELRGLLKNGDHPHVIGLFDFFEAPLPCLVMRLVEGGDLSMYLAQRAIQKCVAAQKCTAGHLKMVPHLQTPVICTTCQSQQWMCSSCADVCHRGHSVMRGEPAAFYCGCGTGLMSNPCQCVNPSITPPVLSDESALKIIRGVAEGLLHLHQNHFIHRDMKSLNVLMDGENPVIIDMGMAKQSVNWTQSIKTGSLKGTPPWTAPEMLAGARFSDKTDVYAFAVVMWEILAAAIPYIDKELVGDLAVMVSNGLRPTLEMCGPRPKWLLDLLQKCWATNPHERPTMAQVMAVLDSHGGAGASLLDPDTAFKQADLDHSGGIGYDEFIILLKKLGAKLTPSQTAQLFEAINTTGSGSIELEEFKAWYQIYQRNGLEAACKLGLKVRRYSIEMKQAAPTQGELKAEPTGSPSSGIQAQQKQFQAAFQQIPQQQFGQNSFMGAPGGVQSMYSSRQGAQGFVPVQQQPTFVPVKK